MLSQTRDGSSAMTLARSFLKSPSSISVGSIPAFFRISAPLVSIDVSTASSTADIISVWLTPLPSSCILCMNSLMSLGLGAFTSSTSSFLINSFLASMSPLPTALSHFPKVSLSFDTASIPVSSEDSDISEVADSAVAKTGGTIGLRIAANASSTVAPTFAPNSLSGTVLLCSAS